jgi:hypothetical protein
LLHFGVLNFVVRFPTRAPIYHFSQTGAKFDCGAHTENTPAPQDRSTVF